MSNSSSSLDWSAMADSLFKPVFKCFGNVLECTAKWITKPYRVVHNQFWKLDNACLYFCGFCLVLVPAAVAYWTAVLVVLLAELTLFSLISLLLGLIFALLGVWPSLITATGLAFISLVRLPHNLFYHVAVTYRTALLRPNLKILSFLLLPLIHLLVPPATFVLSLIFFSIKYFFIAFGGFPWKPWRAIRSNLETGWAKFATDMESFYSNYGHPSGIPVNWDGRVYGLPVDPVVVIICLLAYTVTLVPFSLVVFLLFIAKTIPIFLGTLVSFWRSLNLASSLAWYRRVLTGVERPGPAGAAPQAARSGHDGWIKGLKRSTKGPCTHLSCGVAAELCKY